MAERVIAYIDGFNLYFGLKDKGWKRLYWLDVANLAKNLLRADQQLEAVRYFTARISRPPSKQRRQNAFLEATAELGKCTMHYGQYLDKQRGCPRCTYTYDVSEEKMTDVNIAVEMMADAVENRFVMALLVSADSDLTPPVKKIKSLFPGKRIVAAFPPARNSQRLASAVDAQLTIGRGRLAQSSLPETIKKRDGHMIRRPERWQ
jgi:uncharacterized LabA/DUF88 family protein